MKLTSAVVVLSAAAASVLAATYPPTAGQDLCCAANQVRSRAGLAPLKWLPSIDSAAQGHSNYQRGLGHITHEQIRGTPTFEPADRLTSVGFVFSVAAENVGSGFKNTDDVSTMWENSPGHKINILRPVTVCGGAVANPGAFYTIDFAKPMRSSDNNGYYTLQCNGTKSLGAYTSGEPIPHNPQTQTPVGHKPTPAPPKPVPSPPKPVPSPTKPAPPPAKTTAPPVKSTPPPVKPVSSVAPVHTTYIPAPPPLPPVVPSLPPPPPSKGGKCRLVPKGSIAAGKCKPCKNCGTKASPFRR
ncbi:hypothetical protein H4R26_003109 [Coemansia thaxteri]|uniref:SCP domain-containing protein n=1 Tax=Coemansia thaxteri TaxID=2663907 RepID=A0A9W8BJP9_9FUNG|nr:hypothetical protein H4R26_003109 [Coemansia thaxteri]KAJ2480970.1 hypothetical protein EV174_003586 [Coemansia sp. RSA 2320]